MMVVFGTACLTVKDADVELAESLLGRRPCEEFIPLTLCLKV